MKRFEWKRVPITLLILVIVCSVSMVLWEKNNGNKRLEGIEEERKELEVEEEKKRALKWEKTEEALAEEEEREEALAEAKEREEAEVYVVKDNPNRKNISINRTVELKTFLFEITEVMIDNRFEKEVEIGNISKESAGYLLDDDEQLIRVTNRIQNTSSQTHSFYHRMRPFDDKGGGLYDFSGPDYIEEQYTWNPYESFEKDEVRFTSTYYNISRDAEHILIKIGKQGDVYYEEDHITFKIGREEWIEE